MIEKPLTAERTVATRRNRALDAWRAAIGVVLTLLCCRLVPVAQAQSPVNPSSILSPSLDATRGVPGRLVPTNLPGAYAFTQAPPGFDPATASPRAVAEYGYPPRPETSAGAEALAQWRASTDPGLQRVVPALIRTSRYHRPMSALRVDEENGTISSANWSGYALRGGNAAAGFYAVNGHWTIPTAQQRFGRCSGHWDYSSQWVGIDGFSNRYLLQSGSEADAYCDVGRQVTEYYPWLEWLPAAELAIYQSVNPPKLFPFFPGDYLMVHVWATKWVNGASQTGHLLFTDLTQNWQASLVFSSASVGGTKVLGKSAEWIVERPSVNNRLATLANYTANPWTLVHTRDLNQFVHTPAAPGKAIRYNITMLDDAGAPISRVSLFGNSALWFYNEGSSR